MNGAVAYLAIGVVNTALLYHCMGRPRGVEWLWTVPYILLWPLVVLMAAWLGANMRG